MEEAYILCRIHKIQKMISTSHQESDELDEGYGVPKNVVLPSEVVNWLLVIAYKYAGLCK